MTILKDKKRDRCARGLCRMGRFRRWWYTLYSLYSLCIVYTVYGTTEETDCQPVRLNWPVARIETGRLTQLWTAWSVLSSD